MTPDQISGVFLIIAIALIVATVYGPWQWYCIDRARQRLFEVRGRIFNYAAHGEMAFDSPEYRTLRNSINTRLRFTHRVCWQQMLTVAIVHPRLPEESAFTRQIRSVSDPRVRYLLEKEAEIAREAMAELVIYRSPILLIAFYLVEGTARIWRSPDDKPRPPAWPGERITVEAENIGPFLDRRAKVQYKAAA